MIAIITVGMSCSGKSSIAKSLVNSDNMQDVNRDYLRSELFLDGDKDLSKYKQTKESEAYINKAQARFIDKAVSENADVILSDTHLSEPFINQSVEVLRKFPKIDEIYLLFFHFDDVNDAKKRGEARGYCISELLLERQSKALNSLKVRLGVADEAKASLYRLDGLRATKETISHVADF
ncbi:AAA family ATPase [Vibrio astriarenae]|uniref:AAA family ATPase n=1 Tax=Vibrio astriarenae TaxID=1481923 RepID=UPI003735B459